MMRIEFTDEETQLITEILDNCLMDLQTEIHHTDRFEYIAMLKRRRDMIKKIILSIQNQEAVPF